MPWYGGNNTTNNKSKVDLIRDVIWIVTSVDVFLFARFRAIFLDNSDTDARGRNAWATQYFDVIRVGYHR